MAIWSAKAAGAGLLALALGLGGCGGTAEQTRDDGRPGKTQAEAKPAPMEERVVGQALTFDAPRIWQEWDDPPEAGSAFSMEDVRGEVVIVHFWASWCEPCRTSMPYYDRLLKKYNVEHGEDVLEVVAVNIDAEREVARLFLEEVPVEFITVWDEGASLQRQLGLTKMPVTLLVDEEGVVRYAHAGEEEYQQVTLVKELNTMLK